MPHRFFSLGALAVATFAFAPGAIAAPAPDTRIQAVVPDAEGQALALPFSGPASRYTVERHSPTRLTVWLQGARLGTGASTAGRLGPHAWRAIEQASPAAVRLELALASPGAVSVAYEEARGRLLVLVQPAPAGESDVAEGITTILGRAAFDAQADALIVPYYGRAPRVTTRAVGSTALGVDFANTAVEPSGVQLGTPEGHPLLASWMLTRLPGEETSRVTLVYRYPGGATVRVDEANRRLLIMPVLGRAAAPSPGPATLAAAPAAQGDRPTPSAWQAPLAVRTPAPPPVPTPTPTPPAPSQVIRVVVEAPHGLPVPLPPSVLEAPRPAPVAVVPTVRPTPGPVTPFVGPIIRRVALEAGADLVSESLAAGAVDFGPSLVPAVGLAARYDLDETWTGIGRFRYQDYTLEDAIAPESRHHRDDFLLEIAAAHRLPWGPWQPAIGAGYFMRQVSVANSAPASLQRPFVFAPSQFYHGPWLVGRVEGELAPDWRVELELSSRPFVFAAGDEAVTSIGPLFGYGARPLLVWQPEGPWAVTLGYRVDWLTAYTNDFSHLNHGPILGAAWRL